MIESKTLPLMIIENIEEINHAYFTLPVQYEEEATFFDDNKPYLLWRE